MQAQFSVTKHQPSNPQPLARRNDNSWSRKVLRVATTNWTCRKSSRLTDDFKGSRMEATLDRSSWHSILLYFIISLCPAKDFYKQMMAMMKHLFKQPIITVTPISRQQSVAECHTREVMSRLECRKTSRLGQDIFRSSFSQNSGIQDVF